MSTPTPLRRRAALAIAGLTVTSLGATLAHADVATAAGGQARVSSSISLTRDSSDLVGKVRSRKDVCKKKTRVVLFWLQPGTKRFVAVADDLTSRKGMWRISEPESPTIPAGKYYVKTDPSRACQTGKSKTIRVR